MLYTPETLALAGRANPVLLEGRSPIIQAAQARALGLTDGQVVSAVAEVRGERLKLMLQGRAIDWPAGMRLKAGDTVTLSAHVQTNGSWLFKPLSVGASRPDTKSAPPASGAPQTSAYAPLANADAAMSGRLSGLLARAPDTRAWTHLFQSGAISQLASALGSSLSGVSSAQPGAAATGRSEWFDFWPALRLSMASLSPRGLREAMLANGLSAEALLARGSPAAAQDTKTLLRNLLRKLGPTAPNSAVVSEALDDLERAQVEAVQALDRRELLFSMVLPFTDADPIHLRFKRPARHSPDDPAVFTVDVHTNNQRLGELWLRTVITQPSAGTTEPPSVDMTMWAVRDDVARAAQLAGADLADELEAKGLAMTKLQVFNAARPASSHAWHPPSAGTVVDVNA
ncbi:hypothetical protein LN050_09785 [Comamonadaceae bacterium M7527]|nr:hypothetical protein LN050_09785 [Comamonadaceae bacterium M7527]